MGNDSGKFIFIHMLSDRSNELKVNGGLNWQDLSEEFFTFLQGSGYVLSRGEFADYWAQHSDQVSISIDSYGFEGGSDIPYFNYDYGHDVFGNMATNLTKG